ncbi:hypothetical protein HPB50_015964 [Hyalomma asiaticum]|uniref:Uncharacterized protein n=1 Tax=Hyalomma asiaticum TaxID=266040 RepID=A0ACB7TIM2_HYAAI|nr:hypothetical protein HPB50_015964 [Hyalomma asiaticum]
MIRCVGGLVTEEDKGGSIGDGVDCLLRTINDQQGIKPPFKKILRSLKAEGFTFPQSDKDCGFAAMPLDMSKKKAHEAATKNFKPVAFYPSKKEEAVKLLLKMDLIRLGKVVQKTDGNSLEALFFFLPARLTRLKFHFDRPSRKGLLGSASLENTCSSF